MEQSKIHPENKLNKCRQQSCRAQKKNVTQFIESIYGWINGTPPVKKSNIQTSKIFFFCWNKRAKIYTSFVSWFEEFVGLADVKLPKKKERTKTHIPKLTYKHTINILFVWHRALSVKTKQRKLAVYFGKCINVMRANKFKWLADTNCAVLLNYVKWAKKKIQKANEMDGLSVLGWVRVRVCICVCESIEQTNERIREIENRRGGE